MIGDCSFSPKPFLKQIQQFNPTVSSSFSVKVKKKWQNIKKKFENMKKIGTD